MIDIQTIKKSIPDLSDLTLLEELSSKGQIHTFEEGDILMEPGQYIKTVPLVLDGSIKIIRSDEDGKEIFLYYLDRGDTCAISLTCCSAYKPSAIKAVAEEPTTIIAIPVNLHEKWTNDFRQWKEFVSKTYQNRFEELLKSIDEVAFKKMDERLMNYLAIKARQLETKEVNITHSDIARELGTSREVISRLLKQLENKGAVTLGRNRITLEADYEDVF